MSKMTPSRAEMTEQLFGISHRVNLENKDPGAPCYTLPEMLGRKNITTLRKMAQYNRVRGYSRMDKESLIHALVQNMTDPEWLASVLFMTESEEWALFKRAVQSEEVIDDELFSDQYEILLETGCLGLYRADGHFHYVIPTEIRQVYTDILKKTGFSAEKDRAELLDSYAIAAANLYGIIPKDDFVELFNAQNRVKTDVDEVEAILFLYEPKEHGYILWEEYIANDDLEGFDYEDIENFVMATAGKPRYLPPKQEFLKYSNWDYIEETPQLKALRTYIQKNLDVDEDMTEEMVGDVITISHYNGDMSDIIELLEGWQEDLELTTAQLQALVPLINELHNNTRMWINNGHTPNEIFATERKHLKPLPNEPVRSTKVGRNEPCPCGSGKKYKKCCGQVIVFPGPPQ